VAAIPSRCSSRHRNIGLACVRNAQNWPDEPSPVRDRACHRRQLQRCNRNSSLRPSRGDVDGLGQQRGVPLRSRQNTTSGTSAKGMPSECATWFRTSAFQGRRRLRHADSGDHRRHATHERRDAAADEPLHHDLTGERAHPAPTTISTRAGRRGWVPWRYVVLGTSRGAVRWGTWACSTSHQCPRRAGGGSFSTRGSG
jgi:hypothetical protein